MSQNSFALWKSSPFVRLLLPFIIGIVFQYYVSVSFFSFLLFLSAIVFCYTLFYFLPLSFRYHYKLLQGALLLLLLFCTGSLLTWQADAKNNKAWFGNYYTDSSVLVLKIEEPPIEKEKSFKTTATVAEIINNGVHKKVKGNVLVYFSKTNTAILLPTYGDKILIKGGLQNIKNAGNPGGFNYSRYMTFQQTYHQAFLKQDDFVFTNVHQENILYSFIFSARKKVIEIIQKNIKGDKKIIGIAEALLIGYKEDLDKDVVQAYSNTGVVHIIAISGMHLGLIYVVLVWLFARLPFIKRSKVIQVILILASLWMFSLITGASASVLRSAVMFTCIVVGKTFFKQASMYNSLATSAFLLLCYNPFLLWDVGFQLSYAAVVGIVWLQKPIENIYYSKYWLIQKVWKMCAITIAAQILTLPVCIYYFHQIPTMFLFTNLICVPLSTIILFAEILLIVVSAITPIAGILGQIIFGLTWIMNTIIDFFNTLPGSLIDSVHTNMLTTMALYLFVIFFCMSLLRKNKQVFTISLVCLFLFTTLWSFGKIKLTQQRKIIVYNVSKHKAIDFISNNSYTFCGDEDLKVDGSLRNFNLKPSRVLMQVNEHKDSVNGLKSNAGLCNFYYKKILILDKEIKMASPIIPIQIDALVISKNPKINLVEIARAVTPAIVVFDGSNSLWKITQWKKECTALHLRFHSTAESGAFILDAN